MTKQLLESCGGFNQMYRLPTAEYPTISALNEDWRTRLTGLAKTLHGEVDEIDDILDSRAVAGVLEDEQELDLLVEIGDLLGDLCVYAHSEAAKFGLPLNEILEIIMESNASKLNEDGSASYDGNGKVTKGPNYWKPEPRIKELLRAARAR
jgi:predicted HAD superfamily Cof-like phosphohydrolase